MILDISKVNLSRNDIKRGLILPQEMSELLAEDIGIMIGDGHIGSYRWGINTDYSIYVSGNSIVDKAYVIEYVKKLKLTLYNLNFPVSFVGKNKSEIRLKICSKGLVEFYNKVINLPINKKLNIGIPECIWPKKEYVASCLRGIMDTDFGLSFKKKERYPVFQLKTASSQLVKDCKKAFAIIGIKSNVYLNIKQIHSITKKPFISNYLFINGRKNLEKCIQDVGFSNNRITNIIRKNTGPRGFSN